MVPFRKRIQRRRKPIKETEFPILGSMEECIEKMCLATCPYKGPDPFDAKGLVRYGHRGLVKGFPCSAIVTVYARLGLHRYNFLNGTNYKLNRVKRYNQSTGPAASSYFITLVAHDPAAAASRRQTFQTRVNEQCYGKLNLLDLEGINHLVTPGISVRLIDHCSGTCLPCLTARQRILSSNYTSCHN